MIAGLFILIEDQYTVGDVAEIGGITGTVEHMTLRATELRDIARHGAHRSQWGDSHCGQQITGLVAGDCGCEA